jgi:hypothetical protein
MDLSQLDALCSDLALTAKRLKMLCENGSNQGVSAAVAKEPVANDVLVPSAVAHNIEHEIALAQSDLSGISLRLETLLGGPASFIRSMATQVRFQISYFPHREEMVFFFTFVFYLDTRFFLAKSASQNRINFCPV